MFCTLSLASNFKNSNYYYFITLCNIFVTIVSNASPNVIFLTIFYVIQLLHIQTSNQSFTSKTLYFQGFFLPTHPYLSSKNILIFVCYRTQTNFNLSSPKSEKTTYFITQPFHKQQQIKSIGYPM